ncbi:hypothetical protein SAY86_028268 [Trapa natans]|uniref:UspA domain-containing protein n=1 Tax=Trapa natans TaxID=22666 RepID=A0AAN7M0S7_TRANT|nr:hypothetical protein SAY86_028268 [Trapa natans]
MLIVPVSLRSAISGLSASNPDRIPEDQSGQQRLPCTRTGLSGIAEKDVLAKKRVSGTALIRYSDSWRPCRRRGRRGCVFSSNSLPLRENRTSHLTFPIATPLTNSSSPRPADTPLPLDEPRSDAWFGHWHYSSTMRPQHSSSSPVSHVPAVNTRHSSSPLHSSAASSPTPTAGSRRRIGVAVDLSDESAFAVRWAIDNYIRPGDAIILIHVSPTSVLFGADWGPIPHLASDDPDSQVKLQKSQEEFDAFTASKIAHLARPLKDAQIPYKVHNVKDHDMQERLCLEVERFSLSAVIIGSRGFGAAKRGSDGKLGSVSDYCVHHCICPVVVVRYPDEKEGGDPVVSVKPRTLDEEEDDALVSKPASEEAAEQKF